MPQDIDVSVIICNFNRAEDSLKAVGSALAQRNVRSEVILMDDCSSDHTVEKVSQRYPEALVHASSSNLGYIAQRNRGVTLARGSIVVFLDNDAYFTCSDTLEKVLAFFAEREDVAAVALPFVEPEVDIGAGGEWPQGDGAVSVRAFVGCAAAVRKDAFLNVGGFREIYKHYGEENDLCVRFLQNNWSTVFLNIQPVVHCVSPKRDLTRADAMGIRSTFLFIVLNVPFPDIVLWLPVAVFKRFMWQLRWRSAASRVALLGRSLCECLTHRSHRAPIGALVYRRFVSLPRVGSKRIPATMLPPALDV